jgi:cob(I)alamin adenosyltransferase
MPRAKDEPVRLTRIYTRAGDGGETSLGDGSRVPKLDCRIAAFGTVADVSVPFRIADRLRITQAQIDALEADCDRFNANLPELKSFVLPGGSELAARLHVARATCRRAERDVLDAAERVDINPLVIAYLNRLSDLLFILARASNPGTETLWQPGSSRS